MISYLNMELICTLCRLAAPFQMISMDYLRVTNDIFALECFIFEYVITIVL